MILHLMVWHRDNKNIDGLIKHVANNKAWMHIDALCLKFTTKAHIVKLRLVADGVKRVKRVLIGQLGQFSFTIIIYYHG